MPADTTQPPTVVQAPPRPAVSLASLPPAKVVRLSDRPPAEKYRADFFVHMQNFNTAEGLALSSVLYGYMDSRENLWFCTSGNGVSKYDGTSFTNYSSPHGLVHHLVNTVLEDRKGNLWFGTYGGVSKYDGIEFESFTTDDGLLNNDVRKIMEDSRGRLWMDSPEGVSCYDPAIKTGSPFVNFPFGNGMSDRFVGDLLEDAEGSIWYGGNHGISVKKPSSAYTAMFTDISASLGISGRIVYSLTQDTAGRIWIGTDRGVYRYDPNKDPSEPCVLYTTANGLIDDQVLCGMADFSGNLWFGTRGGVSKLDPKEGKFLNFTVKQGLPDNLVNCMVEDASGSIWFCTQGAGVSRYDGQSIEELTAAGGLPGNAVYVVTGDHGGNLWMAPAGKGLLKYTPDHSGDMRGEITRFTMEQGLASNTNYCAVADGSGNLWLGSDSGLCKFDGATFTTYTTAQGLPDNYVTSLTEGPDGTLWIGTYQGGLSHFDGNGFANFLPGEGLVHRTVWKTAPGPDGALWIATRGGLGKYDGMQFTNFTAANGLPDDKLSSLCVDRFGNLVIGTWGSGVSVLRNTSPYLGGTPLPNPAPSAVFENYSTRDGLANDVIYGILEDPHGNLTIGSNQGLTVLRGGLGTSPGQFSGHGIENYNETAGYAIKDVSNNYGMYLDPTGRIWVGTGDKALRFDYDKVLRHESPPVPSIQHLRVNNEPVSWRTVAQVRAGEADTGGNVSAAVTNELLVLGRKLTAAERDSMANDYSDIAFGEVSPFSNIPHDLSLPYAKNSLTFEFEAVQTSRPRLVRYRYQLEGYDRGWGAPTDQTSATYGNIAPGNHTFLLQAKNLGGEWGDALGYGFTVVPPWYRTWAAYAGYLLLFIFLVYLTDRIQRRRLLHKQRQNSMVRELAHGKEIEAAYSNLKAAQGRLIHAEKMASLGQLTAGIAHEIKNPLNFVNNFSDVSMELIDEAISELKENPSADNIPDIRLLLEDVRANLETIHRHGTRADGIVKSMLQHSRGGSGKFEPTRLNPLVTEFANLAFHGMRAGKNPISVKIELDLDEKIQTVPLIAEDFSRVIVNVCNNAFDAMRGKVEPGSEYHPVLKIATRLRGPTAEIRIKDNGPGIPDALREKILQPFFTTKKGKEGTGLGLSITHDIINAHGGTLEIESTAGEGAEFIVQIPVE